MRTGLLVTAFLALLALSGYTLWAIVWSAFYNPGRHESDPSEYWIAISALACVALVALFLAYWLGRRIRAKIGAYLVKPS